MKKYHPKSDLKKDDYWTPKFSYGKKANRLGVYPKRKSDPPPTTPQAGPDARNGDVKVLAPDGTIKKIIQNKTLFTP